MKRAGGSPPRAWGQLKNCPPTPASAPVHPHGRGDNEGLPDPQPSAIGSPPRAWGQRVMEAYGRDRGGSPPRAWGQRVDVPAVPADTHGSPPRAWGQLAVLRLAAGVVRFTPTGVGTTIYATDARSVKTVHPHGRGDNLWVATYGTQAPRFTPTGVGTTDFDDGDEHLVTVHPHGRGDNIHRVYRMRQAVRFTPTGVGTTSSFPPLIELYHGSPPRAWGQL